MSWPIVFLIALVVGVALFGIGTAIVRSGGREITWTRLVTGDESEVADAQRREMLERLRILDDQWAREILAIAEREERA